VKAYLSRVLALVPAILTLASGRELFAQQPDSVNPPVLAGMRPDVVVNPFVLPSTMGALGTAVLPTTRPAGPTAKPADSVTTGPATPRPFWRRLPVEFQGTTTTMAELYRNGGATQARRPGALWRISAAPQMTLFGELRMGVEALLSSEGSQFRQSVDQVGLNPTWRWITGHAGDFARDYSSLTMQGTRIRGGGIDLKPGSFDFSFQGGRAQRTVAAGSDGAAYRRDLFAAMIGYGKEGGNRISLSLLKAKDDPTSLEQQLVVIDSTVTDTSLTADPLRFATTPQENLVVGLSGGLNLFQGAVIFTSQVGASLFTRDLRSQVIGDEGVGALGGISALQPLRISTSGDIAFEGQLNLRLGPGGVRLGYEQIGAGYTSLGLPSLISDRTGYNVGGNISLFSGRLGLTADTKQQSNNLVDQKTAATDRLSNTGSVVLALTPAFNNTFTVSTSNSVTGATEVAPGVDMFTLALTAGVNTRVNVLSKATALSLSYSYQTAEDRQPATIIPRTVGHNVTANVTATLTPKISLGPQISAVTNRSGSGEPQDNMLLGFNVRARMLEKDRMTVSGNLSNTFSSGRQVQAAKFEVGYMLPWDARLAVQFRHSNYAAFANKPAFNESFLTTTVTRSLSLGNR
jgi:hypothetical protein